MALYPFSDFVTSLKNGVDKALRVKGEVKLDGKNINDGSDVTGVSYEVDDKGYPVLRTVDAAPFAYNPVEDRFKVEVFGSKVIFTGTMTVPANGTGDIVSKISSSAQAEFTGTYYLLKTADFSEVSINIIGNGATDFQFSQNSGFKTKNYDTTDFGFDNIGQPFLKDMSDKFSFKSTDGGHPSALTVVGLKLPFYGLRLNLENNESVERVYNIEIALKK